MSFWRDNATIFVRIVMPPIELPTRETSRGLTADAEALLVQINAAFDEVRATIAALPAPYNPAPLAARVTALEDAPAPGPTLTGLSVVNGTLIAQLSNSTSLQVTLPATAAQPVGYPQLITGMARPGSIPVAYSGSAPVLQITPSWFNGVLTTGNPNFIDWNTDQSVTLNGRYIGADWNSGTTQIIKPKRGQGRWSWVSSSADANAVLAMFTYASENNADGIGIGSELDFEYVLRNGVKGWLLTVHMPIAGTSNRASMSAPFVPFSDADFANPKLFEIDHNDTRTEWYIDGALVGTVTRAAMEAQTPDVRWMTTAVMEQFSSVERHASWAGWSTYTTASMQIWGIKSPDAPVVVAPAPVDTVVSIGASIMQSMFGSGMSQNSTANSLLAAQGHSIPLYGYATGGAVLADAVEQYQTARAAYPNALIFMHLGGNDGTGSRPYPGGVTEFSAGLQALLDVAAGDTRFYPASLTFRNYDGTSFEFPDQGIRPYNDNLLIPWIAANFPHAMGPYGRPKLDFYRRVLLDHETWLYTDGIHLGGVGQTEFRQWIVERLADLLEGITPAEITERPYVYVPPATQPDPEPPNGRTAIINFTDLAFEDPNAPWYNTVYGNVTNPPSVSGIRYTDGALSPMSMTSVYTGNPTVGATNPGRSTNTEGNAAGLPAYSGQLLSAPIAQHSAFVTQDVTLVMSISGLVPDARYRLGMVASRQLGSSRFSEYVAGSGEIVSVNSSLNPPVEVNLSGTANGQGVLQLTLRAQAGSSYGYINGLSIQEEPTASSSVVTSDTSSGFVIQS